MMNPLRLDNLQDIPHRHIESWPDARKPGPNTRYRIPDAALGAFGIFLTHSPSFLDYQRRLQRNKGHNNAHTLFGVEQIPCDNQIRKLLDPSAPSALDPVFVEGFEPLEQRHMLAHCRVLGDQLLVSLDGTNYFSSKALHCPPCCTRQLTNGPSLYSHTAITPVIVCPGQPQVIALPPAYIMPQDGQAKQDCERAAGKRWMTKHAQQMAPHGVTVLGDDLYSNQPFCEKDDAGMVASRK